MDVFLCFRSFWCVFVWVCAHLFHFILFFFSLNLLNYTFIFWLLFPMREYVFCIRFARNNSKWKHFFSLCGTILFAAEERKALTHTRSNWCLLHTHIFVDNCFNFRFFDMYAHWLCNEDVIFIPKSKKRRRNYANQQLKRRVSIFVGRWMNALEKKAGMKI